MLSTLNSFERNHTLKIHISCVVDNDPKFVIQAYNWVISLKETGTVATPFICSLEGALSESQAKTFTKIGARVFEVERFGKGLAAYCNKISQLFVDELVDCDWLILSDADIGFLKPPEQTINGAQLRAKRVDYANPSVKQIEDWLEAIGMPWFGDAEAQFVRQSSRLNAITRMVKSVMSGQARCTGTDMTQRKTLLHNYNGGLYVIRRDALIALRTAWSQFASKLLETAPSKAGWCKHADQIGFACAVKSLSLEVSELESGWNFPTHLNHHAYKTLLHKPQLFGLHYHSQLDNHGLPKAMGLPWIDRSLNALREVIVTGRREHFDNEIFWNFRYKYYPELGSGLGSRGDTLVHKQALTAPAFEKMANYSVVDIGCGDIEFVHKEAFGEYMGIDLSEQAITKAKKKRPDWSFRVGRIESLQDEFFDFVLCMDVLIHQPNRAAAEALVDDMFRVARKGIVLSIHASSQTNSNISFNTFTLRNYLLDNLAICRIVSLGTFRDTEILAVSKIDNIFEDIGTRLS